MAKYNNTTRPTISQLRSPNREALTRYGVVLVISFYFAFCGILNVSATESVWEEKAKSIEALVTHQMVTAKLPGLSVAIVQDGAIVYRGNFGVRNQHGQPVTSETSFALASATKPLIAILILQLVEDRTLSLDDRVVDLLPTFRTKDDVKYERITIRDLLDQTSGLSTYVGNLNQQNLTQSPRALDDNVARLSRFKLYSPPGETFNYSNANFDILGLLLERVYEKPLEDIIEEHLFVPMGMHQSFLITPSTQDEIADRFRYWAIWPRRFDKPLSRGIIAAGGGYASTNDMANLLIALMAEDHVLLSSDTVELMYRSASKADGATYQFGWFNEPMGNERLLCHDGSLAGTTSLVCFSPQRNTDVVVLANASIGMLQSNIRAIEGGIADIVFDRPVRAQSTPILYQIIFWALVTLCIALLVVFARSLLRFLPTPNSASKLDTGGVRWVRTTMISTLLLGLSYSLIFLAPKLFQSTLLSLAEFLPDIGLMLVMGAGFAVAIAGIQLLPVSAFRR